MKVLICADYEAALADAIYDAPSPELTAHLTACTACQKELATLQATLAQLNPPQPPELPETYWHSFEQRVMARVERERMPLRLVRQTAWDRAFSIAAALALVLVGAVVGRMTASTERAVPVAVAEMDPLANAADVQARTARYLQRSKVLLLGVVHFDPATDDPVVLDLAQQQAIADDLVFEATFLKEDLAAVHFDRLHRLVAELEIVLLQLANLDATPGGPWLELVKAGAEAQNLLLKINLEELESSDDAAFGPSVSL